MWYFAIILLIIWIMQVVVIMNVMFHITEKIRGWIEETKISWKKKRIESQIHRKERKYNKRKDNISIALLQKEFENEVQAIESILKGPWFEGIHLSHLYLARAYNYFLAFRKIRDIDENSIERLFCFYKAMKDDPIIKGDYSSSEFLAEAFLICYKVHFLNMTYNGIPIRETCYKNLKEELVADIKKYNNQPILVSILRELKYNLNNYMSK